MGEKRRRVHLTNSMVDGLKPTGKWVSLADDEVIGLQLRMSPTGAKIYQARGQMRDGGRKTVTLGSASVLTVSQARDAARDQLSDMKVRGEDPIEAKRRAKAEALTIREFLDGDYWRDVLSAKKAGANTKQRITSSFSNFLDRRLSDPTLCNAITSWRSRRLKEGVTKSTLNKDTNALRALFNEAVRRGILDRNPLHAMKQYPKAERSIVRFLSPEEEARLREALAKRDRAGREGRISYNNWADQRNYPRKPEIPEDGFLDHLTPMVLVAMNTGLRRGELFGLRWADVDFRHAVLTVHGDTSKTGRRRDIPLNDEALDVLRRWKAQTEGTGLVFPSRDGKTFDTIKKSWAGILKDANIENFRFHDLRHHFASRLVQAGASLAVVRDLMGHSDFKLTLVYAHLAPGAKAEAVALLTRPPVANALPFAKPDNAAKDGGAEALSVRHVAPQEPRASSTGIQAPSSFSKRTRVRSTFGGCCVEDLDTHCHDWNSRQDAPGAT
jgi:integrase